TTPRPARPGPDTPAGCPPVRGIADGGRAPPPRRGQLRRPTPAAIGSRVRVDRGLHGRRAGGRGGHRVAGVAVRGSTEPASGSRLLTPIARAVGRAYTGRVRI